MPKIVNPDEMQEQKSDDGWSFRIVSDVSHIGFPAMLAKWWTFEPSATGPEQTRRKADELLYVIRGTGQAIVNEQVFELDDECVLWLEEGETYHFVAGNKGLEILQGIAPGDKDG